MILLLDRLRARASFTSWVLVGCTLLGGCSASGKIEVNSHPAGARILLDGEDSGLKTPATLEVSSERTQFTVRIEKQGFNPVSRSVQYTTEIDPITPSEAVGTIVCSPCCLGLPLLSFLEPIKVHSQFVPAKIDAHLDPAGQGVDLQVSPGNAQVFVDGAFVSPLTRNLYLLEAGMHEIEVRADGFRTFAQRVRVREGTYQKLEVTLQLDGAGIIVQQPRRVFAIQGEVKIIVDGALQSTSFGKPIVLTPGEHKIEISVEGFEPWESIVRIADEGYIEIRPALSRSSKKREKGKSDAPKKTGDQREPSPTKDL